MAQHERQNEPAAPRSRFTFHASQGRLYSRNEDGKIIDLGKLAAQPDGSWHYLLDGNKLAGGAPSPEAAMADAASRMGFLYLDGQFTAVADRCARARHAGAGRRPGHRAHAGRTAGGRAHGRRARVGVCVRAADARG